MKAGWPDTNPIPAIHLFMQQRGSIWRIEHTCAGSAPYLLARHQSLALPISAKSTKTTASPFSLLELQAASSSFTTRRSHALPHPGIWVNIDTPIITPREPVQAPAARRVQRRRSRSVRMGRNVPRSPMMRNRPRRTSRAVRLR
jgi:hypothetical protein